MLFSPPPLQPGPVYLCSHWPCQDDRRHACFQCDPGYQLPGLSAQEELAERASTVCQEHNGPLLPALLRDTTSCVLFATACVQSSGGITESLKPGLKPLTIGIKLDQHPRPAKNITGFVNDCTGCRHRPRLETPRSAGNVTMDSIRKLANITVELQCNSVPDGNVV